MRRAAARAASRRGSRRMMRPSPRHGASSSASGTSVVLPAPGGATSTALLSVLERLGKRRQDVGDGKFREACHVHVADPDDRPASRRGVGLVMRDQDDGQAGLARLGENQFAHLLAQILVELGERFVEQQRARRRKQHAGQRHARLLAARQRVGIAVAHAVEADAGECRVGQGQGAPALPFTPAGWRRRDCRPPTCAGKAADPGTGCRHGALRPAAR